MYCSKCGTQIDDAAVICPNCGVATSNFEKKSDASQTPQQIVINNTNTNVNKNVVGGYATKSKIITLILAIVLGWLGIHRFYVGKIGTGIIYLFTFGIFGIGWIVDIILIIIGVFKDKRGFPLS